MEEDKPLKGEPKPPISPGYLPDQYGDEPCKPKGPPFNPRKPDQPEKPMPPNRTPEEEPKPEKKEEGEKEPI